MALSWRDRRKLLYSASGALLALVALVVVWQIFFSNPSTCFDGQQSSDERGVDCGGSCALLCPLDARAPVVLWARPFQVTPGSYTAAAYVENRNVGAGAKGVRYSFRLFDERNILVKEQLGSVDIPPVSLVPIVEPAINVGNRTVARAEFAFADEEIRWTKNLKELPVLRITEQFLSPDGTRLSALVVNDSVVEARDTAVAAVLFDSSGVARAASISTIPRLARKSSQQVVFTWPATSGIVRAEITLLPSF